MDCPLWVTAIGLLAQLFFSARVVVQWYVSEKRHRVESPDSFWLLSILGSMFFIVYGWLRLDLSVIIGELLSYYIYMWNIRFRGLYRRVPRILPVLQALLPLAVLAALAGDLQGGIGSLLHNEAIPTGLMMLGITGQLVVKSRFIYQFIYGIRHHESSLPLMFWILSIVGSAIVLAYAIIRRDLVLILGQVSIIPYIRNLVILLSHDKTAGPQDR